MHAYSIINNYIRVLEHRPALSQQRSQQGHSTSSQSAARKSIPRRQKAPDICPRSEFLARINVRKFTRSVMREGTFPVSAFQSSARYSARGGGQASTN